MGKANSFFLIFTVLATFKAADSDTGTAPVVNEDILTASQLSHAFSAFLHKTLKNGSPIVPKASEDDSSDNFASSLWGAFIFSLIGLGVLVAVLILLLQYVCGKRPAKANRNPPPKTTSTEHLVQSSSPRNIAAVPENWSFPPPTTTTFDNQAMEFEDENTVPYNNNSAMSTSPVPYPVQQYQYQSNYGNQSSSREIGTTSGQQTPASISQDSIVFSRFSNETSKPTALPPPAKETYSPPATPITPIIIPPYNQSKSVKSEYNSEYYRENTEEPFKYLEKYAPYSAQLPAEAQEQSNMSELSTKRAVLRNSTPYKVIEERVQGEEYDDSESFVPPQVSQPTPNQQLAPNSKPPQLSSGSFNDGKSRLVRVLPRFHPSQQHHQQQQMGTSTSMAVFQPVAVAPAPPPPPQSQIYAVPRM